MHFAAERAGELGENPRQEQLQKLHVLMGGLGVEVHLKRGRVDIAAECGLRLAALVRQRAANHQPPLVDVPGSVGADVAKPPPVDGEIVDIQVAVDALTKVVQHRLARQQARKFCLQPEHVRHKTEPHVFHINAETVIGAVRQNAVGKDAEGAVVDAEMVDGQHRVVQRDGCRLNVRRGVENGYPRRPDVNPQTLPVGGGQIDVGVQIAAVVAVFELVVPAHIEPCQTVAELRRELNISHRLIISKIEAIGGQCGHQAVVNVVHFELNFLSLNAFGHYVV